MLIGLFTTDEAVLALGSSLLFVAAVFQLFDGLQSVATGVLRGLGDTRTPMITNLAAHWLFGLPVGYSLCFVVGYGVIGLWIGLSTGLIVAGAVALVWNRRFMRSSTRVQALILTGDVRRAPAHVDVSRRSSADRLVRVPVRCPGHFHVEVELGIQRFPPPYVQRALLVSTSWQSGPPVGGHHGQGTPFHRRPRKIVVSGPYAYLRYPLAWRAQGSWSRSPCAGLGTGPRYGAIASLWYAWYGWPSSSIRRPVRQRLAGVAEAVHGFRPRLTPDRPTRS